MSEIKFNVWVAIEPIISYSDGKDNRLQDLPWSGKIAGLVDGNEVVKLCAPFSYDAADLDELRKMIKECIDEYHQIHGEEAEGEEPAV